MSVKRDALANVSPAQTIRPQALAADVTGETVEVRGFEEVEIILDVGLYTDGSFTFTAQESADGSVWTDVAAADLDGSFPTLSASNDNQQHRLGYTGSERYIRVNVAEPTSPDPTGVVASVIVHRRRPHVAPVA